MFDDYLICPLQTDSEFRFWLVFLRSRALRFSLVDTRMATLAVSFPTNPLEQYGVVIIA